MSTRISRPSSGTTSSSTANGPTPAQIVAGIFALFFFGAILLNLGAVLGFSLVLIKSIFTGIFADLFPNMLLGICAGLIIGLIRYIKISNKIIEEVISTAVSWEAITSFKLGASLALHHILIGMVSGLLVGLIGIPFLADSAFPETGAGHILQSLCFWGCPGGGPPGGEDGIFSALLAILIVILFCTLFLSLGVSAVLAKVASAMITEASSGGGQAIGVAIVLAMTRLWTIRLKSDSPPKVLTFNEILGVSILNSDLVRRYVGWLQRKGVQLTLDSISHNADAFAALIDKEYEDKTIHEAKTDERQEGPSSSWQQRRSDRRWRKRMRKEEDHKQSLEFLKNFPDILRSHMNSQESLKSRIEEGDPSLRMENVPGEPLFDGTAKTLLYPGWFTRAMFGGLKAGALVGIVETLIGLFFVVSSR